MKRRHLRLLTLVVALTTFLGLEVLAQDAGHVNERNHIRRVLLVSIDGMLSDMASNVTQGADRVCQKKCIIVLFSAQRYRFFVQISCFAISSQVSLSLGRSSQRANQTWDVALLARQLDRLRPFTGSVGRLALPAMLRCTGNQFLD